MNNFLTILSFLLLISCSQKKYHIDEITTPSDTLSYLKNDMSLLNGLVYCEFGDLGLYVNGKKDGVHKEWYENGQLMFEKNYKNGTRDGLFRFWYENGQLESERSFKDWKKLGLEREWWSNGQIRKETRYYNNLLGYPWNYENKGWDENGRLWNEVFFKDDNRNSLIRRFWYENGQLKEEFDYRDKFRDYFHRVWYENGQLMFEGNKKNGKWDWVRSWNEDGQPNSDSIGFIGGELIKLN